MSLVLSVRPEQMGSLGPMVFTARRGSAARVAAQAHKVNRALLEALAPPDLKESQVQQGSQESVERLGQQALRVQQATLDLWDQWVRLGLAAQMAWLDLWVRPALQVSEAFKDQRDQQARVDRLVRRGIPAPLARQGLRVL